MDNFDGCKDLDQRRRLFDIFARLERAALADLPAVIKKCSTLLMAERVTLIDTETLEELEFQAGHYEAYHNPAIHVTRRSLI